MSTVGELLTVVTSPGDAEDARASEFRVPGGADAASDSSADGKKFVAKVEKNESLRSTRSLSVFRDRNATKTMARSEEMTYDIYRDVEVTGDVIGSRDAASSSSSSSSSSPLRDGNFKALLANSLMRKPSTESGGGGVGGGNRLNGLVSMDPGGGKSTDSASSTLESTGGGVGRGREGGRWSGPLSSASSTLRTADDSGTDSSSARELVSHSVSRYSPAQVDTSNSLVRDRDFRAKMAALFAGRASPVSHHSAPASLLRSAGNNSSSSVSESRDSTLSRDLRDVATPVDWRHGSLEGHTEGPDSGGGRKKFRHEVDGIGTREAIESDGTLTAESEDDLSGRGGGGEGGGRGRGGGEEGGGKQQQQQRPKMDVNLLRDIRNRRTEDNDDIGSRSTTHEEANCSQEELTFFGNRHSQVVEGHGLVVSTPAGSGGHADGARDEGSSGSAAMTSSESESRSRLDGVARTSESEAAAVAVATSVSVEVTDGSETGQSNGQDEVPSTTTGNGSSRSDVLTTTATSMTSHVDGRDSISEDKQDDVTDEKKIVCDERSSSSIEGQRLKAIGQGHLKDAEEEEEDTLKEEEDEEEEVADRKPDIILRRSNYEEIKRAAEKSSDDENVHDVTGETNDRDDVIHTANDVSVHESAMSPHDSDDPVGGGSDPAGGGRSRGPVPGRRKMAENENESESESENETILESQNVDITRGTLEPEVRDKFDLGTDQGETVDQPKNPARPKPRTSLAFDHQNTTEIAESASAQVIDVSSEPPDRKSQPSEPEVGRRSSTGNGALIVRLSHDRDDEVMTPRRSAGGQWGRTGVYEQNRIRPKQQQQQQQQRRGSRGRHVTDSSPTDQEDYDGAGHRSSAMRRRMRRQISRQSLEGEDPGTVSEPEVVLRRRRYVTTTTTPTTGVVVDLRPRPNLVTADLNRPTSDDVTLSQHRSVVVTPVTGRINVSPPSRPRSALGLMTASTVPRSPHHHHHHHRRRPTSDVIVVRRSPFSPTSPTGSSPYRRSVSVLSPDDNPAELVAIDPELRDARKTGNVYHITMCIRPIIRMTSASSSCSGGGGGSSSISFVPFFEVVDTSVKASPRRALSVASNGPRGSWPPAGEDHVTTPSRPPIQKTGFQQRSGSGNPVGFHLVLHGGEEQKKEAEVETSGLISTRSRTGDRIPDFTRSAENAPEVRNREDRIPEIRRGNILIKNRIDTSRPQIVDVITTDDDVDGVENVVVDVNNNMFHSDYLSRKENPLYSSNPDLGGRDSKDRDPGGDPLERRSPGQRSTGNVRSAVGGGVTTKRVHAPTSDPVDPVARTQELDLDESQFDVDVRVGLTRSGIPRRTENGFGGSSATAVIRATESLFGGSGSGGRLNGHSGGGIAVTSSALAVTRNEAENGPRNDNHQEEGEEEEEQEDRYATSIFDTEVKINRDYRSGWKEPVTEADGGHRSKFAAAKSSSSSSASVRRTQSLFTSGSNCQSLSAQTIAALNVRSLLVGSPTSVRQTIKVDRLEDEILSGGQVAAAAAAAAAAAGSDRRRPSSSSAASSSVFDFDKVSERVEMDVTADGRIVLTSTARSERVVPIAGTDDLFKKKAVVVTKRIQLDMTLTPQRRQLFDMVKKKTTTTTTNGGGSHDDDTRRDDDDDDGALDMKARTELYKKFVALAELDRAIAS